MAGNGLHPRHRLKETFYRSPNNSWKGYYVYRNHKETPWKGTLPDASAEGTWGIQCCPGSLGNLRSYKHTFPQHLLFLLQGDSLCKDTEVRQRAHEVSRAPRGVQANAVGRRGDGQRLEGSVGQDRPGLWLQLRSLDGLTGWPWASHPHFWAQFHIWKHPHRVVVRISWDNTM